MADELLVSTELKPPVAPIDVHEVIARNCDVIQAILGPNVRVETMLARAKAAFTPGRWTSTESCSMSFVTRLPPCPRAVYC